jgi:hypothetical protein
VDDAEVSLALQFGNLAIVDKNTAYIYDAVWSLAAAIASTAEQNRHNASWVLSGDDVMRHISSGRVRGFEGVSGNRQFLTNGDWDLNHTRIDITNFGRERGAPAGKHAVVGWMDAASMELTLSSEDSIVWANGEAHPHVRSSHWVPLLPYRHLILALFGDRIDCHTDKSAYYTCVSTDIIE